MKTMQSKFRSTCTCCGGIITKGETIAWSREKGAQHARCAGNEQTGPDWSDIAYEDQCAAACGLGGLSEPSY